MTTSRAVRSRAAVVVTLAVVAFGACRTTQIASDTSQSTEPPPTPAPAWAAAYAALGTDSARNAFLRDSVRGYGVSLGFETIDGTGDVRRLFAAGGRAGGLLVRIEPQTGIYRLTDSALAAGRVIARVVNLSADSGRLGPLWVLPSDTVYWWVERRGTRWVGAFVRSALPRRGILVDSLKLTTHGPSYAWRQAVARWVWADDGDGAWGDCTITGCCEASSDRLAAADTI